MTSIPVRSKFATDAIARYAKATNAKDGGAKFGAAYDKAKQARTATAKPATAATTKPATAATPATAKPASKPVYKAIDRVAPKSNLSAAKRAELSATATSRYNAAMDAVAAKRAATPTAVKKATGGYVTKSTFKW